MGQSVSQQFITAPKLYFVGNIGFFSFSSVHGMSCPNLLIRIILVLFSIDSLCYYLLILAFVPHFLFWKAAPHRKAVGTIAVVQVVAATVEVEALTEAAIVPLGTPIAAVATNVVHARTAELAIAGSRQK